MIKRMLVAILATLSCGMFIAGNAASVPPADYTGKRTPGVGITGTAPWDTPAGLSLTWNISQSGPTFHYVYTLTSTKNPSHMLMELSDTITPKNINEVISNMRLNNVAMATPTPTLYSPKDPGNSNPGLPGNLWGMKISFPSGLSKWTLSFDSVRAPMWGDFYAKDGKFKDHFVYAYNTGFGVDPSSHLPSYIAWIPVPNSKTVPIPEPATYLSLFTLLGGAIAISRRYRLKLSAKPVVH